MRTQPGKWHLFTFEHAEAKHIQVHTQTDSSLLFSHREREETWRASRSPPSASPAALHQDIFHPLTNGLVAGREISFDWMMYLSQERVFFSLKESTPRCEAPLLNFNALYCICTVSRYYFTSWHWSFIFTQVGVKIIVFFSLIKNAVGILTLTGSNIFFSNF